MPELLKVLLKEEGFPLFGWTNYLKPLSWDGYQDWLKQGYHGTMGYMAKGHLRKSLTSLLSDARSLIMVALPYQQNRLPSWERDEPFHIAQYAWGRDYHKIMRKALRRVIQAYQGKTKKKFSYRIFVDTAPVLERDFAVQCGLGWIGKNTCLIHPRWGSFLFLGGVITSLDLPPQRTMFPDRCGSCTRCIEVCPTGAILAPGVLDSRKCLSYLTIEYKGADDGGIPYRHGWLFGCDLCQEVCPYNRKSPLASHPDLKPRLPFLDQGMETLKTLPRENYKRAVAGTAMTRLKYSGFIRNIQLLEKSPNIISSPPLHPALLNELIKGIKDRKHLFPLTLRRAPLLSKDHPAHPLQERWRTTWLSRDYPLTLRGVAF